MTSSPDVERLILEIHASALAENGALNIGKRLQGALRAEQGLGLKVGGKDLPEPWAVLMDFDPQAAAVYPKDWGPRDVWFQGAARTGRIRTGLVSRGDDFVSRRVFTESPFFNEYLRALNIGHMIQVCLSGAEPGSRLGPAALSFYRDGSRADFSPEDVALLSQLAPHLAVAFQNLWNAHSLRFLGHARRAAVDSSTAALFALAHTGTLSTLNSAADTLVRQAHWFEAANGAVHPSRTLVKRDAVLKALARLKLGFGFKILISDRMTGAEALIHGVPCGPDSTLRLLSATAVVWVSPIVPQESAARTLEQLFDLTPAETRILSHLLCGENLRVTADQLNVSIHTARAQLKSILRKTGRPSQGQLLVLAARMDMFRGPRNVD